MAEICPFTWENDFFLKFRDSGGEPSRTALSIEALDPPDPLAGPRVPMHPTTARETEEKRPGPPESRG